MRLALPAIFVLLIALRLAQSDLVWVEEGYPTAAAIQLLDGKILYRDIWFDKPPLSAALYALWGANIGIALRLGGGIFICACCWVLYRFAGRLWGAREAAAAAGLLGFYLTFGIPSAVMALAPDLIMILPHIAAVYCAWRRRAFLAGICAGVAMLTNTKAVFVLAACAVFDPRALPFLLTGFAVPSGIAIAVMALTGSLQAYWEQVWQWGFLYSKDSFIESPILEGLIRSVNWIGFQAAIVVGTAWTIWRERARPFPVRSALIWIVISFAGVVAGARFFPRYYFLLLPPFCLLAARAFVASKRMRIGMLALLLVPLVRFGPRLVRHANWPDAAMMTDSRQASAIINMHKREGDTLLVWGYRPDIFAFTHLAAGSRFLDSQPLTGVIADRHLTSSQPSAPELAAANRKALAATVPVFVVDGLGPYNARLAITNYPDLADWFSHYRKIAATRGTVIYRRIY